jgi:hypothetical protein
VAVPHYLLKNPVVVAVKGGAGGYPQV